MKSKKQFKKGAASFYIVAFSALILLIVATSFASIIISELTRTSNEDLSQSAYDSALAGVEDAKLAYYSYQNCIDQEGTGSTGTNMSCEDVIGLIQNPANQDCDMVARILGRIDKDDEGREVPISELKETRNNMQQAYTCVKIQTLLEGYQSNLSSTNQMRVIKTNFAADLDENDNVANRITKVKISWFSDKGADYAFTNLGAGNEGTNGFMGFWQTGSKATATPPTISVAMLQTASEFNLSDFDKVSNDGAIRTDRAMVYLVPTNTQSLANRENHKSTSENYLGAFDDVTGKNVVSAKSMQMSNDKTATNVPYAVYCDSPNATNSINPDSDYACSATLELPRPIKFGINDERNPDTFEFVVSLPYGKPMTDFMMQFYCDDGVECAPMTRLGEEEAPSETNLAYLDSVQVKVDSTGRANDLYRRVLTWFDTTADSSHLSVMGPLELMGGDKGNEVLKKIEAVRCEYNFSPTC